MSIIVKTVTRLTVGIIFVFGGYLAAFGHIGLGGGIAGGVVVALAYILYVLTYGRTEVEERLSRKWALMALALGALFFLLAALSGFMGRAFLLEGLPLEEIENLAIMLLVGAGLFVLFLEFVTFRVSAKGEIK